MQPPLLLRLAMPAFLNPGVISPPDSVSCRGKVQVGAPRPPYRRPGTAICVACSSTGRASSYDGGALPGLGLRSAYIGELPAPESLHLPISWLASFGRSSRGVRLSAQDHASARIRRAVPDRSAVLASGKAKPRARRPGGPALPAPARGAVR